MQVQDEKWDFIHIETVTHMGSAIAIAQVKSSGILGNKSQFVYNIMDSEQADDETERYWQDEKQWGGFQELPFPTEVRCVGMSLLTVHADSAAWDLENLGDWHLVSDNKHLYVFYALTHAEGKASVYANRFVLLREKGKQEGQSGPLRLWPKNEARYMRSRLRETPENDKDTQSVQSPEGQFFLEPTQAFSMLETLDGRFGVCLLPGHESGQFRWQFFTAKTSSRFAAFSFLRSENGWVDLQGQPLSESGSLEPDQVFDLRHDQGEPFQIAGSPTCLFFQRQETSANAVGSPIQGLTAGRVMLACRMSDLTTEEVVVVDFELDKKGIPRIAENVLVRDVTPAKTALNFDEDVVVMPEQVPSPAQEMTFTAWVRHLGGSGVFLQRGLEGPQASRVKLWWDSEANEIFGRLHLLGQAEEAVVLQVTAPSPTSFVWHHVSLAFRSEPTQTQVFLYVDGRVVGQTQSDQGGLNLAAEGAVWLGGPPRDVKTYALGTESHFTGDLDEVQLWQRFRTPEEFDMYREIKDPEQQQDLIGYWQFNDAFEGQETTARDSSRFGNHGRVVGAHWITDTAPVSSADVQEAGQNLSNGMGRLMFPGFRKLSDPSFLNSADGLVHLYLQGETQAGEKRLLTAHFDTKTARSQFSIRWCAGDETGTLLLIGKQPGPTFNELMAELCEDPNGTLLNLQISTTQDSKEIWRGLPSLAASFTKVLNGFASKEPLDPEVQSGEKVFYDYDGSRLMVPLQTENPGQSLLLVTSQSRSVPSLLGLQKASITGADEDQLQIIFKAHSSQLPGLEVVRNWEFSVMFPEFDRQVQKALLRFNQGAGEMTFSGALARHTLQDGALFFAAPDGVSEIKAIFEDDASDQRMVQLKLTLAQGAKGDEVVWTKLPRSPQALTKILNVQDASYAYSDAMKVQAKSFVVLPLNAYRPVPNGQATTLMRDQPFERTVLFAGVANQATGKLARVPEAKALYQGVHRKGLESAPTGESFFFKAHLFDSPTNGVRPILKPGAAVLHQPGNFGGWVPRPPAVSGYFGTDQATTIAKRPWEPLHSPGLLPPGDFTVESWIRCDGSGQGKNPRLLTLHDQEPTSNGRIMLGLDMVEALFLGKQASAMNAVTDDLRLRYGKPYAFTFWLKLPENSDQDGAVMQMVASDHNALFNVDVSMSFLTLKLLRPLSSVEKAPGVVVPLKESLRGTWQLVTCVYEPGISPDQEFILKVLLADEAYEAKVDAFRLSPINQIHVGVPKPEWEKFGISMQGCGCAIASIGVWHRALSLADIPGIRTQDGPGSQDLIAYWTFSNVVEGKLPNAVMAGPTWDGILSDYQLTQGPGFHAVLATGPRRETTVAHPVQGNHWVHLGAVVTHTSALKFDGSASAYIARSEGLTQAKAFSIDTVFSYEGPDLQTPIQYLFAKSDVLGREASYTLGIMGDGRLQFRFWVSTPKGVEEFTMRSKLTLEPGQAYYLAAGAELQSKGTQGEVIKAELHSQLFLTNLENGQAEHEQLPPKVWDKDGEKIRFRATHARAAIGCLNDAHDGASPHINRGFFRGTLGMLRFWNRRLGEEVILIARSGGVAQSRAGLLAYWQCSEGQGLIAKDLVSGQDATLLRESMWQPSHLTAEVRFYVNGKACQSQTSALSLWDAQKAYGDRGLISVGALQTDGHPEESICGQLDELRFWHGVRTEEQINDHLFTFLRGDEPGLKAYWHFSTGSGRFVKDGSGNGYHLTISEESTDDFWKPSTAPINNEAPPFLNLLAGRKTAWTPTSGVGPCAFEYSDLQEDSQGRTIGVLKRGYGFLIPDGEGKHGCCLQTGFSVGDLELKFVGQVQTKPTLIGFVEGAPPVPSENLTRPYYLTPLTPAYQAYDGVSSVSLLEAEEITYAYETSHEIGGSINASFRGGLAGCVENDVGGIGYIQKLTKIEGRAMIAAGISTDMNLEQSHELGMGSARTRTHEMAAGGDWEDGSNIEHATVGRRYVPDNVGSALVKSSIADLYALRLAKTDSLIDMRIVVDPDVPEDFNIIMFPLNPTYTKQGTLDGKIGHGNDGDYPRADTERGSYYKPKEAYDLVAEIAAAEADLEADYQAYNYVAAMFSGDVSSGLTIPYDFTRNENARNMVNTYVWTADGGTFAQEQQAMASRQESFGASWSLNAEIGVAGDLTAIFGGPGIAFEGEALIGANLTRTARKSKESSRNFELGVDLEVESFLQKYNPGAEPPAFDGVSTPGKVTAYRFNSYYLAPKKEHFQSFFSQVVQQDWLHFSNQSEAVALREAMSQVNRVWRVMHRVTYVSRVPPEFRETPTVEKASRERTVIHTQANSQVLGLVARALAGKPKTPEAIGQAVADVFAQLESAVDWWRRFVEMATKDRSSQAFRDYQLLKRSVLDYMLAYFSASESAPSPHRFGSTLTRFP